MYNSNLVLYDIIYFSPWQCQFVFNLYFLYCEIEVVCAHVFGMADTFKFYNWEIIPNKKSNALKGTTYGLSVQFTI